MMLALDIGASSVKVGLSRAGGPIKVGLKDYSEKKPAPQAVIELARELSAGWPVSELRVAVAGLVDEGSVVLARGLGWRDLPFKGLLEQSFGAPVTRLVSDALAAGSQALCERGQDWPHFVALALGTGVGGVLVARGSIVQERGVGHISVSGDEPCSACGRASCLDAARLREPGLVELGRYLGQAARAWFREKSWPGKPRLWLGGGLSTARALLEGCLAELGEDQLLCSPTGRFSGVAGLLERGLGFVDELEPLGEIVADDR